MISPHGYITVQGWMITELKLSGNELLCYALIYGFSQDTISKFSGSINYISEWLNCSRQTVINVLKSLQEKCLIEKSSQNDNGVFCYGVKKLDWGESKILTGGSQKIRLNNIDNNINNIPPIVPQGDGGCLDYEEFKSRWNRNADKHDNFVAINLMSDQRKKSLSKRMKDLKSNGIEPTVDNFFKTIGKAYMNSSFLRGEKTNFNFTLDFVLQASSFQKLLEGGYEDCQ